MSKSLSRVCSGSPSICSAVFKEAEEKLESLALSLRAHPADLADCSELLTAIESLLEPLKEPSGAVGMFGLGMLLRFERF